MKNFNVSCVVVVRSFSYGHLYKISTLLLKVVCLGLKTPNPLSKSCTQQELRTTTQLTLFYNTAFTNIDFHK